MSLLPGADPFFLPGGQVGVLLCHGFTGCPQSMRPWGEYLNEHGYTVSCARLPGHGTTWQEMNRTRWEDWYAEDERALDELAQRVDTVFVMGLSMGGCLALRLAQQRPDVVRGLVLVNPSVLSLNKQLAAVPLLKHVIPSFPGVANDIKKPGSTEVAYDRVPLKAVDSLRQLWKLTRDDLGKVTAPTLVFHSADDHVVEPENTVEVMAKLGSTEKEERLLTNSFHVATLDNDAPTIFEGSVEFLRRHGVQVGQAAETED